MAGDQVDPAELIIVIGIVRLCLEGFATEGHGLLVLFALSGQAVGQLCLDSRFRVNSVRHLKLYHGDQRIASLQGVVALAEQGLK